MKVNRTIATLDGPINVRLAYDMSPNEPFYADITAELFAVLAHDKELGYCTKDHWLVSGNIQQLHPIQGVISGSACEDWREIKRQWLGKPVHLVGPVGSKFANASPPFAQYPLNVVPKEEKGMAAMLYATAQYNVPCHGDITCPLYDIPNLRLDRFHWHERVPKASDIQPKFRPPKDNRIKGRMWNRTPTLGCNIECHGEPDCPHDGMRELHYHAEKPVDASPFAELTYYEKVYYRDDACSIPFMIEVNQAMHDALHATTPMGKCEASHFRKNSSDPNQSLHAEVKRGDVNMPAPCKGWKEYIPMYHGHPVCLAKWVTTNASSATPVGDAFSDGFRAGRYESDKLAESLTELKENKAHRLTCRIIEFDADSVEAIDKLLATLKPHLQPSKTEMFQIGEISEAKR